VPRVIGFITYGPFSGPQTGASFLTQKMAQNMNTYCTKMHLVPCKMNLPQRKLLEKTLTRTMKTEMKKAEQDMHPRKKKPYRLCFLFVVAGQKKTIIFFCTEGLRMDFF
jgi:hypothetical protein